MLTKCPSCDRQVPADARRCPYCGKKLKPAPFLDNQPPKKRESLLLACWEMLQGKRPVSCAGIAIASSFFVFSLACLLCVLIWGLAPSIEPTLRLSEIAPSTPRPTSTVRPTIEPTTTPFPLAPSHEEISENIQTMTEAQWNRYREDIKGTQVISWTGWVDDVTEKTFSSYELWIETSPPESLPSNFVKFDIPKGEAALAIAKGSSITFSGRIDSVSGLSQDALVITLKDAEWTIKPDRPSLPTPESTGESTPTPESVVIITDEPTFPCDCSDDLYNCEDFPSDQLAQECYLHCLDAGYEDIHDLDRDGDGRACEWEE